MKYLYAYECEKKAVSSPAELQAAIDGNRREGRRPSYSSSLFGYSPAAAAAAAATVNCNWHSSVNVHWTLFQSLLSLRGHLQYELLCLH